MPKKSFLDLNLKLRRERLTLRGFYHPNAGERRKKKRLSFGKGRKKKKTPEREGRRRGWDGRRNERRRNKGKLHQGIDENLQYTELSFIEWVAQKVNFVQPPYLSYPHFENPYKMINSNTYMESIPKSPLKKEIIEMLLS